jgi:hypothetical protein
MWKCIPAVAAAAVSGLDRNDYQHDPSFTVAVASRAVAAHIPAAAAAAAVSGLDRNDYQHDLCAEAFQAFKDCRSGQVCAAVGC